MRVFVNDGEPRAKTFGNNTYTQIASKDSCEGCVGEYGEGHCIALEGGKCKWEYIWIKSDIGRAVDGVIYRQSPLIYPDDDPCYGCAGNGPVATCAELADNDCRSHYIWVAESSVSPKRAVIPIIPVKTVDADMKAEWEDLMAAFIGAFDTPMHRRKFNDEYDDDFRARMRAFGKNHIYKDQS